MLITQTPLRISLAGGGTDFEDYYKINGGAVLSAAIDKYVYVDVNRPTSDDLIRIKYSESETVSDINEVRHHVAREVLRFTGVDKNIEVSSVADIPAGTGLGSSSCYAVGLLHALHTLKRDYTPLAKMAEEDFMIESGILKRPIGKQDPYLAAFGGITILDISKDGKVKVRKANIPVDIAHELNQNLLMFFTGHTRSADDILVEQTKAVTKDKKQVVESMHYIKDLGYGILEAVEQGNLDDVGKKFHQHWQHKKKISTKMTKPEFDKIYDVARLPNEIHLAGESSGELIDGLDRSVISGLVDMVFHQPGDIF